MTPCTLGCPGMCEGHTNPILEAINRAAAQAIDLRGRPTVFTAGPRLTAILARARAMRTLGLPHPWACAKCVTRDKSNPWPCTVCGNGGNPRPSGTFGG